MARSRTLGDMRSDVRLRADLVGNTFITDAEINAFTLLRDQAEANPLVKQFNDAQETLQGIANRVNGFVTKTLEKGRVPTQEEVFGASSGSCGTGCGCH